MIKRLKKGPRPVIRMPEMARHGRGRLFSSHGRGGAIAIRRRIIIGCVAGLMLLCVSLVVGYYQLLAYLQSDSFRQKAESGIQTACGATRVEMSGNLRIDGPRITTESLTLEKIGAVSQAQATGINAEIDRSALISRKLHLRKLSMEEAAVALDATNPAASSGRKAGKKSSKRRKTAKTPQPQPAAPDSPVLLSRDNIQLDVLECKDADLSLRSPGGTYRIFSASITALPAPRIGRNAWQLNVENARLRTPFYYLQDSSVKSATVVYHNNGLDLTDARVMLTPGEMRVKGHFDLKQSQWTLDLQVNKGNVHRILSEDWKRRINGDLYGRMAITGKGRSVTSGVGSFSLQNGVIEGLPFLSQLPVGNTYPYRTIELEKAESQILFPFSARKMKNAWLFDKIHLQAKDGSLIIRGQVLIGTDRRLGGSLTIGVPEHVVASLPVTTEQLTEQLFTAQGQESGYLWVNMNLSGTIDQPEEDLSVRIATLVSRNLASMLVDVPKGSASALLNLLLQQKPAPEEGPNTGSPTPAPSNPLQDAADAAGSLLKSIF